MGGAGEVKVQAGLRELEQRQLVHRAATSSVRHQDEFAFWHALVRDVAYAQIPRAGRARRHQAVAEWVEAVVVNAGDGTHEHPTQALLDLYTMRQRFPGFDGLKVAIVGDVLHSRVARSNVLALTTMGAEVTLVAPPTLLPARVETWGAAVSYDLDAVLPKQDVVMMLRVQLERQRAGFFPSLREYARLYGLDGRRLDAMADHAIVMHPGPMNRGVEIDSDVADDLSVSLIQDQVEMGVAARMAVLAALSVRREGAGA